MLAVVIWGVLLPRHDSRSADADYLSALKDSGFADGFNSDANALAHGRQVCRQLDDGGPQQGLAADKFAVDAFCPTVCAGLPCPRNSNRISDFRADRDVEAICQLDRVEQRRMPRRTRLLRYRQSYSSHGEERQGRDPCAPRHSARATATKSTAGSPSTSRSPTARTVMWFPWAVGANSATASISCGEAASRLISASRERGPAGGLSPLIVAAVVVVVLVVVGDEVALGVVVVVDAGLAVPLARAEVPRSRLGDWRRSTWPERPS